MPRSQNEGLAEAPTFTPHRVNVVADDPAALDTDILFSHGMDSKGWEDVHAQVKLDGTTVTAEVLFWSDLDAAFSAASPAVTFTMTESKAIRFFTGGRRFFVRLSGTFTRVDVDVAGASHHPEEFA